MIPLVSPVITQEVAGITTVQVLPISPFELLKAVTRIEVVGPTVVPDAATGVDRTTVSNNTTAMPADISINLQGSRSAPSETSDWEVAEVVIYPQILNTFQLESIEDSLKTTYGITGYTSPGTPASAGSFTPTGNVTLFARWTANGYNVTFDTSTVTSGTLATQWFSAGTAFSLPANTFTRTGFTFRNWNTSANGSGTTYTNQQSVTLFSDLSLYPQWNMVAGKKVAARLQKQTADS